MRLLGWWYICIGLAFIALAGRAYVAGASGVWLRLVVAVGFAVLGIAEFARNRKSTPPIRKR